MTRPCSCQSTAHRCKPTAHRCQSTAHRCQSTAHRCQPTTQLPADGIPLPADGTPLPADGTPLPADGTPLPVDGTPLQAVVTSRCSTGGAAVLTCGPLTKISTWWGGRKVQPFTMLFFLTLIHRRIRSNDDCDTAIGRCLVTNAWHSPSPPYNCAQY